jgi:hypothetical protein
MLQGAGPPPPPAAARAAPPATARARARPCCQHQHQLSKAPSAEPLPPARLPQVRLEAPSWRRLVAAYVAPARPPSWYALGLHSLNQRGLEQQRRRLLRTWLAKATPPIPEACVGGPPPPGPPCPCPCSCCRLSSSSSSSSRSSSSSSSSSSSPSAPLAARPPAPHL